MSDPSSIYNQAIAAIRVKRMEEARRLLYEVVRLEPLHELAWLALASILPELDHAIECLERVLAINPANARAKEWLASACQEKARRAAVFEMETGPQIPLVEPGDEERPVPRLGQYLLDYRFINTNQLKSALLAQRKGAETDQLRRLGDILLEQGAISAERLDFAVREQKRGFYGLFEQ
jgi:tetratricopeptide (TPR) repeat protein